MAKQLNVNLGFTADTSQAKQALNDLQRQLSTLATNSLKSPLGLTENIQKGVLAAVELKQHLQAATNVNTGTLDFSKFNNSIKQSGTSLKEYATTLRKLGPDGQQAFMSLANAVAQAEVPIRRSNQLLTNLWTTMKNTARWQLSSTMLHGFMGSIQSAYGYAKKLDESLTNIRIVTSSSSEEMAKFAERANRAAQALSTTTTQYTNAALIYYQQGLDDTQVQARTDLTIKMANITQQSAEVVSQQMTAIWNNFAEGSDNLEHFCDVLARLGADTASSTEEIATGLEKFAATADMIGLSYENAAAALATVTATTRQSADTVGTAFKTIFARIQGLKLGETLEDGTDLNKYSEALATVGISIKEQNGQLKDMDSILNEMGAKWTTLAKDQQVALAQAVAGVRQYNQLVALMDNWDFYEENLDRAKNSEGTVEEQQKLYEESWKAAADRVRASMESIWGTMVDSKAFIGILNTVNDLIKFVDSLVDSMGGFYGVLSSVGVLLTQVFSKSLAQTFRDMAYNIQMSTQAGRDMVKNEKMAELTNLQSQMRSLSGGDKNGLGAIMDKQYGEQIALQQELLNNEKNMNEQEISHVKQLMDLRKQLGEQIIGYKKKEEELNNQNSNLQMKAVQEMVQHQMDSMPDDREYSAKEINQAFNDSGAKEAYATHKTNIKEIEESLFVLNNTFKNLGVEDLSQLSTNLQGFKSTANNALREIGTQAGISEEEIQGLMKEFQQGFETGSIDNLVTKLKDLHATEEQVEAVINSFNGSNLSQQLMDIANKAGMSKEEMKEFFNNLQTGDAEIDDLAASLAMLEAVEESQLQKLGLSNETIKKIIETMRQSINVTNQKSDAEKRAAEVQELTLQKIKQARGAMQDWANGLVSGAQAITSLISAINICKGAINALTNPDLSGWEKFLRITEALAMGFIMSMTAISGFVKAKQALQGINIKNTIATLANAAAEDLNKKATEAAARAKDRKAKAAERSSKSTRKDTQANVENAISEKAVKKGKEANVKTNGTLGKSFGNLTKSVWAYVKANAGVIGSVGLIVAGIAVIVGAIAWAINQYNAAENAAKKAQEGAQEAAEAYNKASEAYNNFISNISSYDEAVKGVKGLTQGTDEYTEAVRKANEEAMKLLNTYSDLEYTYGEDGLIIIDEESLKSAKEEQQKLVDEAQRANLLAQKTAKNASLEAEKTQFARDTMKSNSDFGVGVGNTLAMTGSAAAGGAAIGAGIGSIIPGAGTAAGAGIGAIVGAIGGLIGGVIASVEAGSKTGSESEVLDKLAKYYEDHNGAGFESAEALEKVLRNELKIEDEALIKSLTENAKETRELAKKMANRNKNNEEEDRKTIENKFGKDIEKQSKKITGTDKEQGKKVSDVTTRLMGSALGDKTQKLYDETYKEGASGWDKTDAEIQKAYAEAMGWDSNLVKNENGNKATYIDNQGNEIKMSDDVARRYLAEKEALEGLNKEIESYTSKARQLAVEEEALRAQVDGTIAGYKNYEAQMQALGKKLGLTEEQIKDYIDTYSDLQNLAKAEDLAKAFEGWDSVSKEAATNMAEMFAQEFNASQMQIAIDVATTTENIEQFKMELEQQLADNFIVEVQTSISKAETIIDSGTVSADDEAMLAQDQNWLDFLEASGRTQVEFTQETAANKLAIVTEYYANLKDLEGEALQYSRGVYQEDLEEFQAIYDYKQAKLNHDKETMNSLKETYSNIDFEAYMDMDITEIRSKMDEIQERIDEIDGQQLELDMSWDSIDTIEKQMQSVSQLSRGLKEEAQKVGNQYQLTAAQAREWMQTYPEIFDQAQVTSDGLIALDGTVVDNYIKGQEVAVDAAWKAEQAKIDARIAELEAEKVAVEADIELAKMMAEGEMKLDGASKEYLQETRAALTQYYIDSGMDEVAANKAALDTMGTNEKEYSRLVAGAASRNAENQISSAEEGAKGQVSVLGKLWTKFQNWANRVGDLLSNVWKALTGKLDWSEVKKSWDGAGDIKADGTVTNKTGYNENGRFIDTPEGANARKAVMKEVGQKNLDALLTRSGEIDRAIMALKNKKLYSNAIETQDLGDYGETDPSKVDDGKGKEQNKKDKADKDKKKEIEDLEKILERYHEINREIALMERQLKKLSKQSDQAYGPKKIAAMQAEIDHMTKMAEKYGDLYKAQLVYLAADEQTLKDNFTGVNIDPNTRELLNYTELSEQAYNEYKQAETTYNNSAQEEADKEALQKAKDLYDKKIGYLEQYEDTLDATYEAEEKMDDMLDQKAEKQYQKIMYEVEFKVELRDRDLKIIDSKIRRLQDDFYQTSEIMGLMTDKLEFYGDGYGPLDEMEKAADELEAKYASGAITQDKFVEGMKSLQDQALADIDAMYSLNDEMKDYYSNTLSEAISQIKNLSQHYDNLTGKLQHYQNILSLMGHEQNYDLQNSLLQGQIDVLNNQITTSQATMDMLKDQLSEHQAKYDAATTEEQKKFWRERIIETNQALAEEENAYLGYLESVGEAANQILTNSIEKAFKEAEMAMTNDLGFDSILADMDRMNTLTDEFLTNTNKMYETNKMISSAQLAIDKTQNAQAKQKYQDYIKYIEQLQVSGNLTKTELQTAQARYKVLEAEIALEEAKNSKSEVRLTRDSEGNFGYVYTANQDDVAGATQNYLDAQNELYNIGLENTKAYREKTVQLQQQTLQELQQLEMDFRVNHIISEEQYNQQKAAILETSNALLETYNEQFNLAQFTMATTSYNALMQEDTNFYNGQLSRNREHTSLMEANDTEYYNGIKTTAETTQQTLEGNLNKFNAGVLSKEDAQYLARTEKDIKYYTSLRDLADGKAKEIDGIFNTNKDSLANKLKNDFYGHLDTALASCQTSTTNWKNQMAPLVNEVGVSFDGKNVGLSTKIANTKTESEKLNNYLTGDKGLIKGLGEELTAVSNATLEWQTHWEKIQTVIQAYDDLIDRTQTLIRAEAGEIISNPSTPGGGSDSGGSGSGSGGSGSGGGNTGNSGVEAQASALASQAMEIVQKVHKGTIKQDSSGWKNNAKAAGYSDDAITLANRAFNDSKEGGGYSYYYDKALQLVQSYDTGGYTGDWGPEGKLALLHQKELVLNAQDTENLLAATTILREISQMLDTNALIASLGAINLNAMTISSPADQVLQQEVTIHADFPNVTDHNEIEMAIDNLINAASQYANRK